MIVCARSSRTCSMEKVPLMSMTALRAICVVFSSTSSVQFAISDWRPVELLIEPAIFFRGMLFSESLPLELQRASPTAPTRIAAQHIEVAILVDAKIISVLVFVGLAVFCRLAQVFWRCDEDLVDPVAVHVHHFKSPALP